LWSQNAAASATCQFTGAGSEMFNFPSPISKPRDDSTSMQPLTNRVQGQQTSNIYTCTADNNTEVGIGIQFPTLGQAGTYSEGGISYKVFNTSITGVGVVYGFRWYTTGPGCDQNGGYIGWYPWATGSGGFPYSNRHCETTAGTGSYVFGAQLQARLIQTGKISAGTMPSFTLTNTALDTSGAFSTSTGSTNYIIGPVTFQSLSCIAEGGNYTLPTAKKSDFASATSVNTTPFQFTLRSCPSGMTAIKYQLDPVGTVISSTNGTFQNATGTGMAQGVGFRITDETNASPVRFGDSSYTVSSYSPTSGNSSIPIKMNVSYYRTGTAAQVTGGQVKGTAQLTVFYL
jgi:type 1 fimbria pilin